MAFNPETHRAGFESFAAVYSDAMNADFISSAGQWISIQIDRPLDDSDLSNPSVKQCLYRLALYYYQNRDFIRPGIFAELESHLIGLLQQSGLYKAGRNIPKEDA